MQFNIAIFRYVLMVILLGASWGAQAGRDSAEVTAIRATSSLLLWRGEGFQAEHLLRLEGDMANLKQLMGPGVASDPGVELLRQLEIGVSLCQGRNCMSSNYPNELAHALRAFLIERQSKKKTSKTEQAATSLEYLALQYISRSYIDPFVIDANLFQARAFSPGYSYADGKPDSAGYVASDERQLLPEIDGVVSQLVASSDNSNAARWEYLRAALSDMNSGGLVDMTSSGRAFAPLMVDRYTRRLTSWLMSYD